MDRSEAMKAANTARSHKACDLRDSDSGEYASLLARRVNLKTGGKYGTNESSDSHAVSKRTPAIHGRRRGQPGSTKGDFPGLINSTRQP